MSNQSNNNQTVDNSLDTPNNTTQQLANNESNNSKSSSEGIPIIADGALCKCPKSPGEQVGIIALSQSRVFVNGGSLLAVTTNDKTVASLKFSKCGNKSCSANITWQNAYTDTQILGSLQILTMNSYGVCSQGGKIEFINCGQSEQITVANTKNITGTQTQQITEENPSISTEEMLSEVSSETEHDPLATTEDLVRDLIDQPVIEILEEGTGKSSIIKSITPVTYPQSKLRGTVKQPRNVLCTFKGAASGTYYWKIRSEDMSVLHEKSGAGQITIRFPKLGRYVIEAYKTTSYVVEGTTIEQIETSSKKFQNALIVEVVENEITLKAQKTKCSVGNTVDISLEKLFSTLDIDGGQITYQVFSQGIPVADNTQAEITGNSQAATVTFKSAGNYAIHATSSRGIKINPTKVITVEALQVKEVTAKGVKKYKARKGEDLELKAVLNYDTPENQEKVKWEVYYSETENGSQAKCHPIVNGTIFNNKPPINIFTNIGFYSIYAFINGRSNNVKAVVEICQPKFVSTLWKDANGNNIKEVGKRESVYAHINMEGVAGLEIVYKVYCINTGKLIEEHSLVQKENRARYKLKLSDNAIKEISDGHKIYIKPVCKDTSITIVNKTKDPKEYPITYTKKEKITALQFYADKECTQVLSVANYGSTVYARALTRNLSGKSLELYIFRISKGRIWDTKNKLFKKKETVTDEGYAVFEIEISKDWHIQKSSDSYVAIITEEDDRVFVADGFTNEGSLTLTDKAEKEFVIGQNLQFMKFINNTPLEIADNKTITTVNQVAGSNGKTNCPRCKKFTEANFKQVFSEVKKLFQQGTNELKSTTIKDFADALDKAFNEFNIDNCNRKIHFLTQITCETGDFARIDENLNYSKAGLIKVRASFWPEKDYPKLYASDFEAKFVNKPEALANYVYRDKGGNADEASGDGYKYRGRGLIQLTFKNNYKLFEDYLVKKGEIEENTIIDNPDLLLSNIDYLVRSAAWFWKYGKSGNGTDRLNINTPADKGDITKITLWTHGGTSTVGKRIDKYGDLLTNYPLSECNFHLNNLAIGTYIDYYIKSDIIEKYIPKNVQEDDIFHYRYFYYDENNVQQKLCAVIGFLTQKWGEVTSQNKSNDKEWVKGESGSYYYKKIKGEKAKLVRIPNELQIPNLFGYSSTGTERYCINPDAFSILLAAMIDTRYTDYHFNGCVQTCGKGHPSKSHKNGYNIDMRYLWKDKRKQKINITNETHWKEFDLSRHSIFMSKLAKRGYNDFLVEPCDPNKEKAFRENKLEGDDYTYKFNISPHKDHVHIQGIFYTKIKEK